MTDKERIDNGTIDDLVGIWVNDQLSISNDAGFEGDSILARVIEYGIADLSNGLPGSKMEHSIRLLRGRHKKYPLIAHTLDGMKPEQKAALIAKSACVGIWQDEPKIISWNAELRAAEWQRCCLEMGYGVSATPEPLNNYKYALKQAYKAFARGYLWLLRYEKLKSCVAA